MEGFTNTTSGLLAKCYQRLLGVFTPMSLLLPRGGLPPQITMWMCTNPLDAPWDAPRDIQWNFALKSFGRYLDVSGNMFVVVVVVCFGNHNIFRCLDRTATGKMTVSTLRSFHGLKSYVC